MYRSILKWPNKNDLKTHLNTLDLINLFNFQKCELVKHFKVTSSEKKLTI